MIISERQKKNKKTIEYFFLLIVYRLSLDWIYFNYVCIKYAYYGFEDNRDTLLLIMSWIIMIIFSLIARMLMTDKRRDSILIVISLVYISFIPFTTLIYSGMLEKGFIISNCTYWMILLCLQIRIGRISIKPLPVLSIKGSRLSDKFALGIGLFSFVVVFYISAVYTHFRINLNLYDVYDIRVEAHNLNLPSVISYVFYWSKAISTVLLAYSLINKKRLLTIIVIITALLSFGIDGSKTTFFLVIVVFVAVELFKFVNISNIKSWILRALCILSMIGVFEIIVVKTNFIAELIIRRIMFLTNYIEDCYFKFFTQNTPDYYRSSFLRLFGISSPYSKDGNSIGLIIGNMYIHPNMNCNSGLISDGLANFGLFGIVLSPFFLVAVLHLYDRSTVTVDKRITFALTIYLAIILLSSFLPAVLLTHGLAILIILLSFIGKKSAYEKY